MCLNERIVYGGCGCVKHDHYFCTQNQEMSLRRATNCQNYHVKTTNYERPCERHNMDPNAPPSETPNISPTRANRYAVETPTQRTSTLRKSDQEFEGQRAKRNSCLCDCIQCLKRRLGREGTALPAERTPLLGERSAEQEREGEGNELLCGCLSCITQ